MIFKKEAVLTLLLRFFIKIYFVKLQYNEVKNILEKLLFENIKKVQIDVYVFVSF